jgi:hypothetical protein
LNHYLPLVIAAAALALLACLLCSPSWRKKTIPLQAALAIGACAVVGGVGYGIVHSLGQNPETSPRLELARGKSVPPPGQKPSTFLFLGRALRGLPPPLQAGEKAPAIEASGWLNGSPPGIKDRNVRVMVVDVWGNW